MEDCSTTRYPLKKGEFIMKMLMFDFRESEKEYFKTNTPNDIEIEFIEGPLNEDTELTDSQKTETSIISVFISSELSEKVISQFRNLQIIATRSTGFNHINIEYCRKNNIAVINVPDYGKNSVAQYTIGMILSLTRNVFIASNDIRNRQINYPKYEGKGLHELSLGVIGTGSIGSAVCELANKFDMKIYAHDIKINDHLKEFVEYVDFETLIKNSDIITLHVPYIVEFYHMISDSEINKMKDGAYLINTSRGELVNTSAIYNGLMSGKLKGVALDVLECEHLNYETKELTDAVSKAPENCLENVIITDKMMQFDNVIITPHIAYNTNESVINILNSIFLAIKKLYNGEHMNRIV